jgi:hypothetical protein
MAEPPSTSPPAAGGAERDLLLATKLHLPRSRPDFLSRQRLLERLAEGAARELTLVCAPAGFGKASLLGDWPAAASPRSPGCRWTPATTIQRGFGVMWPPRSTRPVRGSPSGPTRCFRPRSRRRWKRW